jgi:Sulfate permease family
MLALVRRSEDGFFRVTSRGADDPCRQRHSDSKGSLNQRCRRGGPAIWLKAVAGLPRTRIDADRELIGFGAANVASGLFGGFPVTGADSRTAINDALGGKTQVAGLVAAVSLTFSLLFLTRLLVYLPLAALGAVLALAAVDFFDDPDPAHQSHRIRLRAHRDSGGGRVRGTLRPLIKARTTTCCQLTQPPSLLFRRLPGPWFQRFDGVLDRCGRFYVLHAGTRNERSSRIHDRRVRSSECLSMGG